MVPQMRSETDRIFVILGHFFAFYNKKNKKSIKNQNFEKKWKKCLEILSSYTYMCTINEDHDTWFLKYKVQQTNFVISGHFLPFQPPDNPKHQNFKIEKNTWRYHFIHLHHEWQLYDVWFLRYQVQQTKFFVILDRFLPFYQPMDPENQNFEKTKTPEDIILQMCNINDSHMMYGSWDMAC